MAGLRKNENMYTSEHEQINEDMDEFMYGIERWA